MRSLSTDRANFVAKAIASTNALKFGLFSLPGRRVSPYFVDFSILMGFPDFFKAIVKFMAEKASEDIGRESFTRVCGVSLGSVPLATGIALELAKPIVCLRGAARSRDRYTKAIEGPLFSGDRILVIDDVCATGSSLMKAVELITSEGGIVENALVVIYREEGGKGRLRDGGVRLNYISTITKIVDILLDMGDITDYQRDSIVKMVAK